MSSQRNLSIDVVKLTAAFGVVIIHLSPSTHAAEVFTHLFWFFAVPFFLLISLYFFIKKAKAAPCFKISELGLDRILIPYVVWTVIYTLMRLLKYFVAGKSLPIDMIGLTFFGGAAVQLYFLPLLLLFQAESLAVIFLFRGLKWRFAGLVIALTAVIFGYIGATKGYLGFKNEPEQGLIYVIMAFLLISSQTRATGRQINVVFGWLTATIIVCETCLGFLQGALGIMQGPLVGYGISALAVNGRFITTNSTLLRLLTCSYGIYLAHIVFLESFEIIAYRCGFSLAPYSVIAKILMGSLICLSCVGFILIARLHWLPTYLFFGEGRKFPQYWFWQRRPKAEPLSAGRVN